MADKTRVIKTFDTIDTLGDRFGGEVFQEISSENLFVFNKIDNSWYQYRWASGHREIMLVGKTSGELPLVLQVYP